jgi:predicted amidohydrolase
MDNSMIKITVAQFEINTNDVDKNLENGLNAIWQAALAGSNLIQLPELWLSGYDLQNCEKHSQITIHYANQLQQLADQYRLTIGGSYITAQNGNYYNSFLLFQPGCSTPAVYNKIHLFSLLEEDKYFKAGEELTTAELEWGKVGIAICYDLRFPELARAYANHGIDCLLLPAQWGIRRSEHWRTLLKARAIENQIFIAASCAIGSLQNTHLAGYSAVLDPWGNILAEAGSDEPACLTVGIDLNEIIRVRQMLPSGKDQRRDLYRRWLD